MRNLAILRSRSLGINAALHVEYAADGTIVTASDGMQFSSISPDLQAPLQMEPVKMELAKDVPSSVDILQFQMLPTKELVVIGRRGEILKSVNGQMDLIGQIPDGILAACWSPSFDLLSLVTGKQVLLLMTADFDVVHEGPLETSGMGQDTFVSVGWGKKETQFHGSAGKEAAQRKETVLMRPVPGDDGLIRISWRGDGQLLAVSHVDSASSARRIRIFDRFGALQAISEPVSLLEQFLAWMPNGALIASTALHADGRRQVVFFERNGLRHGEFFLRRQDCLVADLHWNRDSDILAVRYQDGLVELWTSKNYHWYLKLVLPGRYTHFVWSPTSSLYATGILDGQVEVFHFGWVHCLSQADDQDKLSLVAVIDGSDVFVTPFAVANVPPPMSLGKFAFTQVPSGCAIRSITETSFLLVLSHGATISLVLGNMVDRKLSFTLQKSIEFDHQIGQVVVNADYIVVRLCNYHVLVLSHELEQYGNVEVGQPTLITPCGSHLQSYSGDLIRLADLGFAHRFRRGFCPSVLVLDSTFIGLNEFGFVTVNNEDLVAGCTFLYETPEFVLVGLGAEKSIRFLHKASQSDWPELVKSDKEEVTRRMEAGSEVVVASMASSSLVLQAPRGNLETVYPRALVLASVRRSLACMDYRQAYLDCRRHRLDLNILVDANPIQFMATADLFVKQVASVDYLNLFVAALNDQNCAETKYPGFDKALRSDGMEDKVNTVCGRIRNILLELSKDRYVETIMTTYVCQRPARLDLALQAIRDLVSSSEPDVVERSLTYLIFLVDAGRLYDEALGLYDLPLALSIARRSQKDPKEYVQFLEDLHALPHEAMRRFRIDAHLGRHDQAATHYYQCVTEGLVSFEAFLEYVQAHHLFKHALRLVPDPSQKQTLYRLFAEDLRSQNDLVAAAALFRLAGDISSALEVCVEAGLWQEALSLSVGLEDKSALVEDLCERLIADRRHLEAYNLALVHLGPEAAFDVALAGGLWQEAASLDPNNEELKISILSAADQTIGDLEKMEAELAEKGSRLLVLQKNILAPPPPKKTDGSDVSDSVSVMSFQSGAASTIITRSSAFSGTTTQRNRKKAERAKLKAKPGSPFERDGLRLQLADLFTRTHALQSTVKPILLVLSALQELEKASMIQTLLIGQIAKVKEFVYEFRGLQAKINNIMLRIPLVAEASNEALAEEVEAKAAWLKAFDLPTDFYTHAWSLAHL